MKRLLLLSILSLPLGGLSQSWTQIGPNGGYFKEFTIHPTDANTIYCGSDDGGGIWKSTDAGANWNLITADHPNITGWSIEISSIDADIIYACDVYSRYAFMKSSDAGSTWTELSSGLITQYDRMVSGVTEVNLDTLLISTGEGATTTPPRPGNGVFRTFDGGLTWEEGGLQGSTVPCIERNAFNTIFAGTEGEGLMYSNDFGDNWFTHPDISATAVVHEIDVQDSVIAVAASSGVYLSTNYGINFTLTGLAGDINFDICIHRLSPEIELFNSTFGGLQHYSTGSGTWTVLPAAELSGQLVIGIESDGSNLYISQFSNGLIYKSTDDGGSWNEITDSPKATELNDVFVNPSDPNHIITTLLGSYNIGGGYNRPCLRETTDGGLTWSAKGPSAHGLVHTYNTKNSSTQYLGTFSQGLFRSDDNFDSYTQLISGNRVIGDIAVDPVDTAVVIVTEVDLDLIIPTIKRSTDGGSSFTVAATLVANRIIFNANNPDTVFAGTEDGIFISTDNGQSWNSWLLSGNNILSLYWNQGLLYAGSSLGELFLIEDGSSSNITGTWTTPLELKSIYSLNDVLFVGLSGAEKDTTYNLFGSVWSSSDNGSTWSNVTNNMNATNVYGNNIIASDGNEIILGTYGGGLYKSNGFALGIETMNLTSDFHVFPNPATDKIRIISASLLNTLAIVDLSGRVVLEKTYDLESGYSDEIQLTGLEKGYYLLQVNGGSAIKLVLE